MNSVVWRVSRLLIWIRPMFVDRLLFTALTARKSKRVFLKYALEREFHDDNEYIMQRWLLISFRKTVSKFVPKKSNTTIKRFRKPSCVLTKKLSYMRDFSMIKKERYTTIEETSNPYFPAAVIKYYLRVIFVSNVIKTARRGTALTSLRRRKLVDKNIPLTAKCRKISRISNQF